MRGVFFLLAALALVVMGFWNPVVFALGYVWADIVAPGRIAPYALGWISLPMVFGILVLLFLPKAIGESGPRWSWVSTFLLLHGIWMTLSLNWAVHQTAAWFSWEYAIKALIFALILPWFLKNRVSVEAMVWTLVLCVTLHAAPYGLKFVFGGGGYGQSLGLISNNSNYAESSTLAMLSISVMPLILFLMRHQSVFTNQKLVKLAGITGILLLVVSMAGTYARTGLVCLAALIVLLVMQSGQRLLKGLVGLVSLLMVYIVAPDRWFERMLTIDDTDNISSMGRVAVWKWTLEYVSQHPFGGSFGVWRSSQSRLVLTDGSELVDQARAFHSIYFEVLGSLGYLGLALYMAVFISALIALNRILKIARAASSPDLWVQDLSRSLFQAVLIYLVGGVFIGVAFQSYPLYLISIIIGLAGLCRMEKAARV
jgi:probable O-glycosylation ligase (exosortase A-associated)